MADYRWAKATGLADWVLREIHPGHEDDEHIVTNKAAQGFIMKSSPTTYVAWVPNDAGNRMEFFDVETAKAWVFTQVRMNDGTALLCTDSLC